MPSAATSSSSTAPAASSASALVTDASASSLSAAVASSPSASADADNDHLFFTTVFSSDDCVTNEWTVAAAATKEQRPALFARYRSHIVTTGLLKYLTYLSWLTRIHDVADETEKAEWTQDFKQHVCLHECVNDKTIHTVGRCMKLAWFVFSHGVDNVRLGHSLKALATISITVIHDNFLLARFLCLVQLGDKKYTREELPDLAKRVLKEDGIPFDGWRYRRGALQYDVLHSGDWLKETDAARVLESRWYPASELMQHTHWTTVCKERDADIRELSILSVGTEAEKMDEQARCEVVFSNKARVWMSDEDIEAANIEQWTEKWKEGRDSDGSAERSPTKRSKGASSSAKKTQSDAQLQARIAELEQQLQEQRAWRAAKEREERIQQRSSQQQRVAEQLKEKQFQLQNFCKRAIPLIKQVQDQALREQLLKLMPLDIEESKEIQAAAEADKDEVDDDEEMVAEAGDVDEQKAAPQKTREANRKRQPATFSPVTTNNSKKQRG